MKKLLLIFVCVLLLAGGAGYLFREQLWEVVVIVVTRDTFIASDKDSFDPGLPVGTSFPPIKAIYQGELITDVRDFAHHKGMVFIANRSADW
ncbi:MAG: hypothetical protein ACI9SC_001370 [Gammaproteobacteria bacterium]|jgi:hypothetical protein